MDQTLGDSLERSGGSALYLPESSEGPVGGDFLGDRPYTFERRAVASTMPDDAAPSHPPPAARRERRGRRRRGGCPGDNAAEEEAVIAAVIQPPAAAAASPPIVTRRSRKRRRRASEARRREEQQRGTGGAPSSSSPPAADGRFPNVCPEPRHTQPSSSSSCSSLDEPSSDRGHDRSAALGSLSFLTEEERAWLGAETTEQSAPPPSSSRETGGEDAAVRDPQVEGDALLARQLQEQFDWERRAGLLALPPPFAGFHHQRRRQPDHGGEAVDDTATGPHHRRAQSARTRQHRDGTRSSHDATEDNNGNTFDLLPDSNRPCMTGVQWAAFSSLMNGNNDPTTAQPRGRGRGGGSRRGPQRGGGGGGGGSGIEAGFLLLGQEDHNVYGALADFEGAVPAASAATVRLNKRQIDVFPTKTYDPAAAPQGAGGNTRCQICFCDYAGGEELRMLSCFHDYHAACIDRWLRVNATCPVCRCSMAKRHSPRA